MKKALAVMDIASEHKKKSTSVAAGKRIIEACRTLGLNREETVHVLWHLAYCTSEGNLYEKFSSMQRHIDCM